MSEKKINIRLQKYIADCGVTSRRKAEELIVQGRVQVNGDIVNELGAKVNPHNDVVVVDGQILDLNAVAPIYIVLNKPRGYVTTLDDPEGRKTVMDFVREIPERIYPVGRLDYLSEGLLIMTNDGDVANKIMHPRYEVIKVYEVKVFGAVSDGILSKLKAGTVVDGAKIKPKAVRVIKQLAGKTWLEFRLGEGRNREIRKLCEACGITVDKLKRVAIGNLSIDSLRPGNYRSISKRQLFDALGMNFDGTKNESYKEYLSAKKTINLKKKGAQPATLADDRAFRKFRKDTYFETLRDLKETKKTEAEQAKAASYAEREEKHQKRQFAKKKREIAKKNGMKSKVPKNFRK